MKKSKNLELFICMMMVLFPLFAGSNMRASEMGDPPIIIYQDPIEANDNPRSLVDNPFFAELSTFGVVLGSSESIGTVSVRITSTAGDDYSTYFNTSIGMILLPISGDAGDYLISITTPDGVHFIGEFSL